jgi:phytoene desaturase
VASGLHDTETVREKYFNIVLDRIENMLGENIRDHIVFRRSYAHNDFIADYNAFKGNASGLANTLGQTANLKPSIVSRKLNNLSFYGTAYRTWTWCVPCLNFSEVVGKELIRRHKKS